MNIGFDHPVAKRNLIVMVSQRPWLINNPLPRGTCFESIVCVTAAFANAVDVQTVHNAIFTR